MHSTCLPFGQAKLNQYADRLGDTRLTICHGCIDKLGAVMAGSISTGIEGQTFRREEAEGNVEVGGPDACNAADATTNGKKNRTKKAKPASETTPPPFKSSLKEVVIFVKDKELFSFRNIIITPFDHNILSGDVKTKLKGLDMGSEDWFVLAGQLSVHMLRNIATAISLSGHNLTRLVLANMIIDKVGGLYNDLSKGRTVTAQAGGTSTDGDVDDVIVIDGKGNAVVFNMPRFFNVLFSDKVAPLLANRGSNLTKDDLENKVKVDQELFSTVVEEYNEDTNVAYGTHAFNSIPMKLDPAVFWKVPCNAWKNALRKFKDSIKDYEDHKDLKAINPDIGKCTNKYMIYLHYYIQLHPELLSTCVALLPRYVA